ncbi:metal ABC transporter solute-binding protein, Zn/Mn family [Streptomyces chartreusis]|uniref:metal ABC transporter solute-binding protein, Zn/Mn family n=1 Tax=Streptomyces chartreusis TaxID=1969 RepID=UPI00123CB4EB|nr:zinc ABC transporter substrate-binding protein [Streptomyces chartreusis]QEV65857.1 ABC transporter substrate-binding protein [Streptomyces chartreusis]GGW95975.1 metal ABC transporter substrate-binding protein [Streptomyces chartreusis]
MPMPSRRLSAALLTGTCLTLLAGCAGSSDTARAHGPAAASAIPVVASTNVYGDLARRIGGAKVQVTSIISDPDQDPHSYEASTRNQLALSKAEVVIENGGGYDDFVDRMLKSAGPSLDVINAVEVSGKTAPKGGELNEHVWYDFPTVAELAERIAAALGEADPADAATFTQNAKDFVHLLRPLERKEARIKAEHGGESVAITEPVPLYMIEASGLRNATPEEFSEAIEEGDDVSPRTLRSTLALFTGKKVEALVYNEQTSGPQTEKAERAAEAAGIPVVPVTETLPKGKDYLAWMTANVDALASALAK